MKKELLKLLKEFIEYVDDYNLKKKSAEFTDFEDPIDVNLWNFVLWLNWTESKEKDLSPTK
jgi:hypothetical protein